MTFGSVASAPNTPDPPTNLGAVRATRRRASRGRTRRRRSTSSRSSARPARHRPTRRTARSSTPAPGAARPRTRRSRPSWAALALPAIVTAPALTGTATQAQALSSDTGAWSSSPSAFARVWRRCDAAGANCADISGATAPTYTLTSRRRRDDPRARHRHERGRVDLGGLGAERRRHGTAAAGEPRRAHRLPGDRRRPAPASPAARSRGGRSSRTRAPGRATRPASCGTGAAATRPAPRARASGPTGRATR